MKVITDSNHYNIDKKQIKSMQLPQNILMVNPKYFDVEYGINPHMFNEEGELNSINIQKAKEQWQALKEIYKQLGFKVFVAEGVAHLPDMVFCANQTFPFIDRQNQKSIVLSNMYSKIRQKEVAYIEKFFKEHQYESIEMVSEKHKHLFESMGDALWIPGKRMVLGGYGFRTDLKTYDLLSKIIDAPIAVFKLSNPKFYHLDTCLSILDSNTALYCPEAFDKKGIKLLSCIFSCLIPIPLVEADAPGFACNAFSPDQKHVILNKGSLKTNEMLVQIGFLPIEVDTSEFIKAGGSVFCMKLMFF